MKCITCHSHILFRVLWGLITICASLLIWNPSWFISQGLKFDCMALVLGHNPMWEAHLQRLREQNRTEQASIVILDSLDLAVSVKKVNNKLIKYSRSYWAGVTLMTLNVRNAWIYFPNGKHKWSEFHSRRLVFVDVVHFFLNWRSKMNQGIKPCAVLLEKESISNWLRIHYRWSTSSHTRETKYSNTWSRL